MLFLSEFQFLLKHQYFVGDFLKEPDLDFDDVDKLLWNVLDEERYAFVFCIIDQWDSEVEVNLLFHQIQHTFS